jgi:hypothetical protein
MLLVCGELVRRCEKPVEKQDKLPARPRKRNTSLLPPGKEMLNASTSGRRKGIKPLVTVLGKSNQFNR